MQHFVRRSTYMFPFDVFWGMCGENACNVLFFFCSSLHGTMGSYLRDALQMLWHAFLFRGVIRPVGLFLTCSLFLIFGVFHCLS
jgi:hypothetical protein